MAKKKSSNRGNLLSSIITIVCVLAAAFFYLYFFEPAPEPPEEIVDEPPASSDALSLTVLDVGQGDCLLLHADGKWALVDGGEQKTSAATIKRMRALGVDKLSLVVATHPHADHIGGLPDIMDAFEVENFWMPDKMHTTKTFENLLDAVEQSQAETLLAQAGDTFSLGSADIRVLWPLEDMTGFKKDDLNNHSVVLTVSQA